MPALDLQVDAVERERAREPLRDAGHPQDGAGAAAPDVRGPSCGNVPMLRLRGRVASGSRLDAGPTTSPPSTASEAPFT